MSRNLDLGRRLESERVQGAKWIGATGPSLRGKPASEREVSRGFQRTLEILEVLEVVRGF